MKRRPRAFWERVVDELRAGGAVDAVARRYGVEVARLRWWRWKLRCAPTPELPRMVPVVVAANAMSSSGHVDVAVRGLVVRVATGTDVDYVAALLRALEPC